MQTPAFKTIISYLDRLPLEERMEMSRALTETVNTPGWDVFARLLGVRVDSQRTLTESWAGIPSYEEMVSQHGTLRGLLTAQTIPEAVFESGERANIELRQIVAAQEAAQ